MKLYIRRPDFKTIRSNIVVLTDSGSPVEHVTRAFYHSKCAFTYFIKLLKPDGYREYENHVSDGEVIRVPVDGYLPGEPRPFENLAPLPFQWEIQLTTRYGCYSLSALGKSCLVRGEWLRMCSGLEHERVLRISQIRAPNVVCETPSPLTHNADAVIGTKSTEFVTNNPQLIAYFTKALVDGLEVKIDSSKYYVQSIHKSEAEGYTKFILDDVPSPGGV